MPQQEGLHNDGQQLAHSEAHVVSAHRRTRSTISQYQGCEVAYRLADLLGRELVDSKYIRNLESLHPSVDFC